MAILAYLIGLGGLWLAVLAGLALIILLAYGDDTARALAVLAGLIIIAAITSL